ncbi:MAG: YggT family protein [Bacilli bacterium]
MIYCLIGLSYLLSGYFYLMIINILLSWFPTLQDIAFFALINRLCQWYLRPFHGILVLGMIDFTPMIGLGIYSFILNFIGMTL